MSEQTDCLAQEFRDSARALLAVHGSAKRLRAHRNGDPGFERAVWTALAQAGWTGILASESHGGLGLGLAQMLAVLEELGRTPLPEPVIGAAVHPLALLQALPASALRDARLAEVVAGTQVIGVAWQEAPGQLEPAAFSLRAEACGADRVRLSGCKRWVVPGRGADGWLVAASEAATGGEAQPSLWWVPASSEGIRIDAIERVDGSPMANLVLEDCEQPIAHRLASGPAVQQALAHADDMARLAQAAELLGVARDAFDRTLDYLKTRVQFGKPIGSNQALQHRMVDAFIALHLAGACLAECVSMQARGAAPLALLASRAKARCAETALRVTRLSIQLHGAIGFTDEYDLGLYWKRALHLSNWLGSAAPHRARLLRLQGEETGLASIPDRSAGSAGASSSSAPPHRAGGLPGPDTDWAAMPEAAFREAVRAFLQAEYPPALRYPSRRLRWAESRDWYMKLSRQGMLAPAWPREHGGMALPPDKLLAFIEEFEEFGAARLPDQGIINLGPLLIRYGTPEQQRQWLPPILAGEHVWCQGYSEPNAGSDLASLRTEAIAEGADFVVTGQKIWTTLAHDATHIYLLVRTDKAAKKQDGISFLLVDLRTPGVTVRPIRNIAGEEEFCEVFFDKVRVPQANLVGGINQGWTIAKALLGYERLFIGSPKTCQYALGQLRQLAQARSLFDDPVFCADYATLLLDLSDLRAAYAGFADMVKRGDALPASVSLLKIFASETYTRIASALVEAATEDGAIRAASGPDWVAPLFNATITTIYGGSNEIQRNILARQVLGLPA